MIEENQAVGAPVMVVGGRVGTYDHHFSTIVDADRFICSKEMVSVNSRRSILNAVFFGLMVHFSILFSKH